MSMILVLAALCARSSSAATLEEAYAVAGERARMAAEAPRAAPRSSRAAFPKDPAERLRELFGPEWKTMLADLAEPVDACLRRRDTDSPIFHGCVDWHSSVHGAAALLSYMNLTGDRRYA